jgi:predicted metal-binding membrane protein
MHRDAPFLGIAALLFLSSAAVTIAWSAAMSAMGSVPMAGGWTLSMAWMRMCEQSWGAAAASFLGMWTVMMVAMMLPSLLPMLRRYRLAIGEAQEVSLDRLTVLAGAGYFFVWIIVGLAVFPLGVGLAALCVELPALAHAVPLAGGVIVFIAGALQFTAWKARRLACCRKETSGRLLPADARLAWRHGLSLGRRCVCCCGNLMLVLLVVGIMDLGAMGAVTAAITVERLAPAGERFAQAIGAILAGAGLFLIVQTVGLA